MKIKSRVASWMGISWKKIPSCLKIAIFEARGEHRNKIQSFWGIYIICPLRRNKQTALLSLRPCNWQGSVIAPSLRAVCFAVKMKTVLIWESTFSNANSMRGLTSSNTSLKKKGILMFLFRTLLIATPACVTLSARSNITWNGNALQNDNRLGSLRLFLPPFAGFDSWQLLSLEVLKANVCRPSFECIAFLQRVSLIANTTWSLSSDRACCTETSTSVPSICLATAFTIPITMYSNPCLLE